MTQNQEKRKMIQKLKRWLKKRKRYDTIVLGMTTLDKKRSTVRKEALFYEKDRPDPAGHGFGPDPLPGADAESYDDDPLEETAVPTSEAVLEEAEPVPARSSECAKCGEMRVYIQKIGEYEAGPWEEACIHKTAGTDAVYYNYCIYQEVCRGCGYKSPARDVRSGETSRECYGW